MKTVKHELEARKLTIPDEEPMDDDVHLILIDQETDLSQLQFQLDPTDPTSSEILPNNVRPQTSTNKEIPPTETHPNPNEEGNQAILNDQTGIFEEINRKNFKDTEKDNQIDNVVNNLCKQPFSSSYAGCFLPCLLVLLFLRVGSLRLFWGIVVRGFARRDLC